MNKQEFKNREFENREVEMFNNEVKLKTDNLSRLEVKDHKNRVWDSITDNDSQYFVYLFDLAVSGCYGSGSYIVKNRLLEKCKTEKQYKSAVITICCHILAPIEFNLKPNVFRRFLVNSFSKEQLNELNLKLIEVVKHHKDCENV